MTNSITIHRLEIKGNYIKGYGLVEEKEYEAISIPTTKGLYGMNMIAVGDETLKDIVDIINNSLGDKK